MKRLIQINTVSNYGSTGRIMEAIGLLAEADGWDSKIATGSRYSLKSELPTYTISTIWQNRVSAAYSFLTGRHGFANKRETIKFIEWLNAQQPDVIHLHNIHSYTVNVPLLFKYLSSCERPVIWTLHDCWAFTGHCSHFITANCYRWKTGCHDCPQIRRFPKSLFFDRSSSNYRDKRTLFTGVGTLKIVTVSEWLARMARQSYLGVHPVEVIPNGVDLRVFRPRQSSLRETYRLTDKIVLLGVSTDWCQAKGLDDYVKLRQSLPDNYAIVLVGMNEKQIPTYSEKGLICVERTKDIDALVEWYNTADIVLNISYAETFGLPVAEGYACGKPAVVYDNTALSELIGPSTGLKVETGNISELSSAIAAIAPNSSGSNYEKACRERASLLYDRDKNYRRYIDLYNRVIG